MNKEQLKQLENDLWAAADNLRANSDLKTSEYSTPVLGLIFLKFADNKYRKFENGIVREHAKLKGTRREKKLSDIAIEKCGFYLPDHARLYGPSRFARIDFRVAAREKLHAYIRRLVGAFSLPLAPMEIRAFPS